MIKYKWMGHNEKVKLQRIGENSWLVMLEQPNQDYCMGSVAFDPERERYIARAKGREFVASRRIDAVMRLMDFMHDEAMAAKLALQGVVIDNWLSEQD